MVARKLFRCFGINFRPIFYVLAVIVILAFARFVVVTRVDRRHGVKDITVVTEGDRRHGVKDIPVVTERDRRQGVKYNAVVTEGDRRSGVKDIPVVTEGDRRHGVKDIPVVTEGDRRQGVKDIPVVTEGDRRSGVKDIPVVTVGDKTRPLSSESQRWLDKMLTGRWVPKNYTSQEMDELESFHKRAWTYHKIPVSLQREDKKCGTVSFPNLFWFRAVCDPKGDTPCCKNGSCVDKPVQECQCPECYDLRQPVHAEFSNWEPQDATVRLTPFTGEREVCRVLEKKTVYFIGDSFMRQVYTSALAMLRDSKPRHVIRDNVPLVNVTNCDKYYRYLSPCGYYLILDSLECNGTTKLSMRHLYRNTESDRLFKAVQDLNGTANSWLVVGMGIHNNYNMTVIRQGVIDPMLKLLQNSEWPKLIWMAAQSPGLLKTGSEKRQQSQAILDYNEKLKSIFVPLGIPIMNFFQLTKGVFSFDGAHYGKGLNDVKVNILLNFFQQESTS